MSRQSHVVARQLTNETSHFFLRPTFLTHTERARTHFAPHLATGFERASRIALRVNCCCVGDRKRQVSLISVLVVSRVGRMNESAVLTDFLQWHRLKCRRNGQICALKQRHKKPIRILRSSFVSCRVVPFRFVSFYYLSKPTSARAHSQLKQSQPKTFPSAAEPFCANPSDTCVDFCATFRAH